MSDVDLQELLDPHGTGRDIELVRRVDSGLVSSYYVAQYATGTQRWVNVTKAATDEEKHSAIRASLPGTIAFVENLSLSNLGIISNSRNGELVAVVQGKATSATLSIVGGTGVIAINGDRLEATASTFTLGVLNVTIRQSKAGFANKDQTFVMTVYAPLSTGSTFSAAQIGSISLNQPFTSALDIYNPTTNTGGVYNTFYNFGADGTKAGRWAAVASRTLSYTNGSANAEGETYTDAVFSGGLVNPFTLISGGGLIITASATPASLLAAYETRPVVSGLLRRAAPSIYGYYEVRFLNELKPGYWSAAWMYEAIGATGAELDIQESGPIFGQSAGDYIFQNTHATEGGIPAAARQVTPRPDQAFRTVGVLLKSDSISYYIDGIETVAPFTTPASMDQAKDLLLDLALGWFGDSPAGAYDPAQLPYKHYVDYQRYYPIAGGAASLLIATPGVVTFPLTFTSGSTVPTGVGFLRGTSQRSFTSAGVETAYANNVPAMSDLGILIEPAAASTFGALDMTPATKTNTTIAFGGSSAPDGTTNVSEMTETTANGVHTSRVFVTYAALTQYTVSVLVKRGTGTRNFRIASSSGTELDVTFNLGAGTVSEQNAGTGAIIARGSWYLCSATFTSLASPDSNLDFYLINGTTSGGAVYVGTTSSLRFTEFKVELGAKATSYIGVSGVSRSACSMAFNIPGAGVGHLTYTFDDNSTQQVAVSPGAYYVPTTLNRAYIKTIAASA